MPKTLVRHLIDWVARTGQFEVEVLQTLRDILAMRISPELVPALGSEGAQSAESVVGPYEPSDASAAAWLDELRRNVP